MNNVSDLDDGLSTGRIIKWAMLSGIVMAYLGVGYYIQIAQQPPPLADHVLYVRLGLIGVALVEFFSAKFIVEQMLDPDNLYDDLSTEEATTDLSAPTQRLLSGSIIGLAMGESVGFIAVLMGAFTHSYVELLLGIVLMAPFFWHFNPSEANWKAVVRDAQIPTSS